MNRKILFSLLGILAIVLLISIAIYVRWFRPDEIRREELQLRGTTPLENLNDNLEIIRDENQYYITRFRILYSIYAHNRISSDEFYELYNLLGRN
ncbi:MAG: hypothetical protein FWC79_07190 [Oscillospiraceae bacterium]|nr:hypothetical protein [Oscillospiraceae bacterium]